MTNVLTIPISGDVLRSTDAPAASATETAMTPSITAMARTGRCTDRSGWFQISAVATTTVLVRV